MNSDSETIKSLKTILTKRHRIDPDEIRIIQAPYRVCPLGAHIDHQLGQVTAMALDRGITLAYVPSASGDVCLSSLDFPGEVEFHIGRISGKKDDDWGNYARGAAAALQQKYNLQRGIYGITAGKLGEGGLSSSAAIGVAYLLALEEANGLEVSPTDNIALDQAIENGYLGLNNGILDQAAILLSRRDHLTVIDCAAVEHRLIEPCQAMPFKILIAFSGIRQALVNTDYNRRVEECAQAAQILLQAVGRPQQERRLGKLTDDEYIAHKHLLCDPPARRAAHFFSETQRVEQGIAAWTQGDLEGFGKLMTESGHSSIHNYECGSPPIIDLYEILVKTEGVYGARFSGAGFRGCCVALVDPDAAQSATERVQAAYARRHPDLAADAPVLVCGTDDGVRIL